MNPEPEPTDDSAFFHWPADWSGRQIVDLDCVGDPSAWLEEELPDVQEVLSADPEEDASTAAVLANQYIRTVEDMGYSLPHDFEGTREETREIAIEDFIGFIREKKNPGQ